MARMSESKRRNNCRPASVKVWGYPDSLISRARTSSSSHRDTGLVVGDSETGGVAIGCGVDTFVGGEIQGAEGGCDGEQKWRRTEFGDNDPDRGGCALTSVFKYDRGRFFFPLFLRLLKGRSPDEFSLLLD